MLCIITLYLSGCAVGPDYQKSNVTYQSEWSTQTNIADDSAIKTQWWAVFNDNILNDLVEQAVHHNHDLAIAKANVKRAKALRQISNAGRLPAFTYGATAERARASREINPAAKDQTLYNNQLDASWELDLFGGVRRAVQASDATILANIATRQDVLITVIAEVAQNYFTVRGLQKQIATRERNVALLTEIENLVEVQFNEGIVSELDLARARGEREETAAVIPNLQAELAAAVYRLSVLTGYAPEHQMSTLQDAKPLATPPDIVPIGLRSELLLRRPDIKLAEYQLMAATAEIGVARAELFPKISLTGAAGTSARVLSDLFTGNAFSYAFGGLINWSVFQGGALRANVQVKTIEQEQALIRYEQAIFTALEDVEASLIRYGKEWQTLQRLHQARDSRHRAFDIAKLRYQEGEDDYLVILDTERSLISIEDKIVQSETKIRTDLAQLYKALGGGWEVFEE